MNSSPVVLCCAALCAASALAEGPFSRGQQAIELAPAAEESWSLERSTLANGPALQAPPLQAPGMLKGAPIQAGPQQGPIQTGPEEFGYAPDKFGEPMQGPSWGGRGYFSWFGGCMPREPSCCDNVWDSYCGEKRGWCHRRHHGHGCGGMPCGRPAYTLGGMRWFGHGGHGCGIEAPAPECDTCGKQHHLFGQKNWFGGGGLFGGHKHGGCATCGDGGYGPTPADYAPGKYDEPLVPQPEPDYEKLPVSEPAPLNERAAQQRGLIPPAWRLFQ